MESLYSVQIRHNVRIPMRDGLELSANLFSPLPREPGEKFPAILEMIPYRKDDWRYNSDVSRMTYFAQRGYVGCRLDIRGTGSSPGLTLDEYTDDVHYLGGCMVLSEFAQYAVSQIGMNAMPPKPEYAGKDWAAQWKERTGIYSSKSRGWKPSHAGYFESTKRMKTFVWLRGFVIAFTP